MTLTKTQAKKIAKIQARLETEPELIEWVEAVIRRFDNALKNDRVESPAVRKGKT